jgi:DNA-directed RNA polymerase omega subunit
MNHLSLEDFNTGALKMDSLYRLVDLAARRANQLNKPESRALVPGAGSKKPVIVALEEILLGKVTYRVGDEGEDEYEIG